MKKLVCAAMSAALTISLASLTNFSYLCIKTAAAPMLGNILSSLMD